VEINGRHEDEASDPRVFTVVGETGPEGQIDFTHLPMRETSSSELESEEGGEEGFPDNTRQECSARGHRALPSCKQRTKKTGKAKRRKPKSSSGQL
jgi:hypothetical protein